MFRNFSIVARIGTGFAVLLLLVALAGVIGGIGAARLGERITYMTDTELTQDEHFNAFHVHIGNLRRYEKDLFINIADPAERAGYFAKWEKTYAAAERELEQSKAGASDDEIRNHIDALTLLLTRYGAGMRQVHGDIEAGKLTTAAEANAALKQYKRYIVELEDTLKKVGTLVDQHMATLKTQMTDVQRNTYTALGVAVLLALATGSTLAFFIAVSIRRPLKALEHGTRQLADTLDLRQPLPAEGRHEIGITAQAFNRLLGAMRGTVEESHQHSRQVLASADALAGVGAQIAAASHTQSEAAGSTAAAVEQLSGSIDVVAGNARNVEAQAEATRREASQGAELASAAAADIRRIADMIGQSAAIIASLNQRSGEIGTIVAVIKDIADQTNLLALNAAIEAARAGEAGRGFAVVADEVRKLAERTTQATGEISTKIQAVQRDTDQAAASMGEARHSVDTGVEGTHRVAEALAQISRASHDSLAQTHEIARAIHEQSTAAHDIARHIEQIARMSDDNRQSVGTAAQLADQLKQLAGELDSSITRFTV